ncbi:uncharacterized protein LOC143280226 [Babylonia areolata]|uniref:uncharacterized protein LOC143280226 n=1 Tax=Babylonia areolata TaxID=304850 RepID=UPI003FD54C8B
MVLRILPKHGAVDIAETWCCGYCRNMVLWILPKHGAADIAETWCCGYCRNMVLRILPKHGAVDIAETWPRGGGLSPEPENRGQNITATQPHTIDLDPKQAPAQETLRAVPANKKPSVSRPRRGRLESARRFSVPPLAQQAAPSSPTAPCNHDTRRDPREPQILHTPKTANEPEEGVKLEVLHVNRVCASSSSIQITIGGTPVEAKVDSGAEITIVANSIFDSWKTKPQRVRDVVLYMADQESALQAFLTSPVPMRLGKTLFNERVYVAPISDQMLLGHDLLHHWGAVLDLKTDTLQVGKETVPMKMKFKNTPSVARVTAAGRTVVPPHSVVRVRAKLDRVLQDYYVEPSSRDDLLQPRTVQKAGTDPVVCLVNVSDRYCSVKKGQLLAVAHEIDDLLPDPEVHHQEGNTEKEPARPTTLLTCNVVSSGAPTHSSPTEIPEHLRQLVEDTGGKLTAEQQRQFEQLLLDYRDVFAKDDYDLGTFTAIEHEIDTGGARPIKQHMRRTPAMFAGEEEAHLKKMLNAGVIQESVSEWASAPVLIRKKDGSVRWCIDYRALNEVTVKDTFPLPLVEDCLDTLAGHTWFSKLDANSAYWQVRIKESDRKKTAFLTKFGLFEHVRMGFGLTNAPATFSRAVNLILRGLTWKTVLAFLDDILVLGKNFQDHLTNLRDALQRFRDYGMKLKPSKCLFFQSEVEFLGRKVSSNMLAMSEKDTETVAQWPIPKSTRDVESFLGFVNYHRMFVKDLAKLAQPLYGLTGKNKFHWGVEQQEAFDRL